MPDVQTFRKLYLPHPNSDLDVLYINLDLLDECYPMVKSKLPFEDFAKGGLIWYAIPVRPACKELPILGVNKKDNVVRPWELLVAVGCPLGLAPLHERRGRPPRAPH
jgi:hypothetical protein